MSDFFVFDPPLLSCEWLHVNIFTHLQTYILLKDSQFLALFIERKLIRSTTKVLKIENNAINEYLGVYFVFLYAQPFSLRVSSHPSIRKEKAGLKSC